MKLATHTLRWWPRTLFARLMVVLVVGLPASYESEGFDRDHLRLPEDMYALVNAVLTANPRTAMVLINGAPVELDFAAKQLRRRAVGFRRLAASEKKRRAVAQAENDQQHYQQGRQPERHERAAPVISRDQPRSDPADHRASGRGAHR